MLKRIILPGPDPNDLKENYNLNVSNPEKNKMIFPPAQVVFDLLLLSTAVVLIWDIRNNPFGEEEARIQK